MRYLNTALAGILFFSLIAGTAAAERLQGSDDGRPPAFTVDGPWLLDWRTRSEFPLLSSVEIRLYEAASGEYVGIIAELKGTGSGSKFFEEPGTYQLVIVGTFVDWEIDIQEISAERAATLRRRADGEPSVLDQAREVSRLVPEASFESWRPEGNGMLLLFRDGYTRMACLVFTALRGARRRHVAVLRHAIRRQRYGPVRLHPAGEWQSLPFRRGRSGLHELGFEFSRFFPAVAGNLDELDTATEFLEFREDRAPAQERWRDQHAAGTLE